VETHEEPGATPYDAYNPGSKDPFGRIIKTVVGRHRHMIVYVTDDHAIGWNYDRMPERLRPAVGEFQSLNGLAHSCLSTRLQETAATLLAAALYNALLTPDGQNPRTSFATARAYIRRKSTERARLHYVLLSLAVALGFGAAASAVFLATASASARILAIGVAGGVIGAAISIVQRGWQLPVDPLDSVAHFAARGFVRVFLGGLFGVVFVTLSKANLAFGTIADNVWALFGLSVAAGVSERLVPDLLERSAGKEAQVEDAEQGADA